MLYPHFTALQVEGKWMFELLYLPPFYSCLGGNTVIRLSRVYLQAVSLKSGNDYHLLKLILML